MGHIISLKLMLLKSMRFLPVSLFCSHELSIATSLNIQGQVLANLKALDSDYFSESKVHLSCFNDFKFSQAHR